MCSGDHSRGAPAIPSPLSPAPPHPGKRDTREGTMEDCTRCGTYRPDFRFPITHLRHKTWSHAAARRAAPGRWSRPPRAKNPPRIFLQIGAQPRTTWRRTTVRLHEFSPRHSFLIAEKPLFGACFGYRPHPPSMENKEHWTQPGCRNPLDFRRLGINLDKHNMAVLAPVPYTTLPT